MNPARILQTLATVCLLALAPLAAAQDGGLGEVRLEIAAGDVQAVAGQPLELSVVKLRGGSPAVGERIEWLPETAGKGDVQAIDSLTRAGAEGVPAGSARARFVAADPGTYGITVQTPVDAACTGSDCRMVASRIAVVVAAAATADGRGVDPKAALLIAGGGAAAMALLASGGDGDEAPGARLGQISGNGQNALTNNPLAAPLVVEARDNGKAADGAVINWSASGGAVLSATQTTTSASGRSSINVLSVGPGPGPITITASRASDPHASVVFTADVYIAGLDKISGDNQTTPVDTTTALPLVVRTLVNGAPQPGITVQWQVFGGATLSGTTTVSDGTGLASTFVDVGAFPGSITILVSRSDSPSASQTFTVNAVELRDLVLISGDGQNAAQGQPAPAPLAVRALDNGAGDGGVSIFWSASGGAVLSSNSTVTDPAGFSNVTVTDVGFGLDPVTVTATRADVPSLSVTFTLNIDPATMSVLPTGDGQSGLVTTAAPLPVQVQLLDGAGAPMAGQSVSWFVSSGDALLNSPFSTTDASGVASMNFTFGSTPGPITIEASAFSGAVVATATATATAPSSLNPVGPTTVSGDPGDTLADFVVDTGTGTAGIPVTWTVLSGDATVSPASSVTDALGQARTTPTLGSRPDPDVVIRATGPGGAFTDFTVNVSGSVVVTGPTTLGGDAQDLTIGVPSAPMTIKVVDTGTGNPIPALTVHWSTSNGTMENPTTVTDANGETSNKVTISNAGAAVVTAVIPTAGVYDGSTVVFNHNGPLASVPNLPVNEASVAEALDAACGALGSGPLNPDEQDLVDQCNALAAASGSDPEAVGDALTAMLPDVAQTQTDSGQAAAGAQFDNLNGRIVQLRSGAPLAQVSFTGLNLAMSGGQVPLATLASLLMDADPADAPANDPGFAKWGFFVSGNIGRGESDPTSLTPKYDYDVNGLTAGVDYRWNDDLVLGVALGYTSQDTDLANDQGSLDTQGFSVSAYTTWYSPSEWYLDGVLTWSNNSYDHKRRIQYVLPGENVDQVAAADSDGTDLNATLTFGRDWAIKGWTVGAFARAQYDSMSFDAFEEEVDSSLPGSGLALRVESRDVSGYSMILGGKLAYAHSASWGILVPQLDVEWQNDFQSDAEAFRGYFVDDPTGTPILVLGDDLDSNYFKVGIGMSMVLTQGRSGFINYERFVARSGMSQEMLSLGLRWEF